MVARNGCTNRVETSFGRPVVVVDEASKNSGLSIQASLENPNHSIALSIAAVPSGMPLMANAMPLDGIIRRYSLSRDLR